MTNWHTTGIETGQEKRLTTDATVVRFKVMNGRSFIYLISCWSNPIPPISLQLDNLYIFNPSVRHVVCGFRYRNRRHSKGIPSAPPSASINLVQIEDGSSSHASLSQGRFWEMAALTISNNALPVAACHGAKAPSYLLGYNPSNEFTTHLTSIMRDARKHEGYQW